MLIPNALFQLSMHVQENCFFLDSPKPRVYWCVFFNQLGRDYERSTKLPQNMFVTRLPGESIGYEESIEEVIKSNKLIFAMSLEIRIFSDSATSKFPDCFEQDARRRKLDQDNRKIPSALLLHSLLRFSSLTRLKPLVVPKSIPRMSLRYRSFQR